MVEIFFFEGGLLECKGVQLIRRGFGIGSAGGMPLWNTGMDNRNIGNFISQFLIISVIRYRRLS